MGADQSSQHRHSKVRSKNPKRSQSSDCSNHTGERRILQSSPRNSICSDTDIPYTSYVKNASISEDQPDRRIRWSDSKLKIREKHMSREKRNNKSKSVGSLVVVKAAAETPSVQTDSLFQRLLVTTRKESKTTQSSNNFWFQEIPSFVPIVQGSLKLSWTKDPGISERIDPNPLIRIALFYEERMTRFALGIEKEQSELNLHINDINVKLKLAMSAYAGCQAIFGKFAENLGRITELSNNLTKCHQHLNQSLEKIEFLNNLLPKKERLEAFVWTTG